MNDGFGTDMLHLENDKMLREEVDRTYAIASKWDSRSRISANVALGGLALGIMLPLSTQYMWKNPPVPDQVAAADSIGAAVARLHEVASSSDYFREVADKYHVSIVISGDGIERLAEEGSRLQSALLCTPEVQAYHDVVHQSARHRLMWIRVFAGLLPIGFLAAAYNHRARRKSDLAEADWSHAEYARDIHLRQKVQ